MTAPITSVVVCAYSGHRMGKVVASVESLRTQSLSPSEVLAATSVGWAVLALMVWGGRVAVRSG